MHTTIYMHAGTHSDTDAQDYPGDKAYQEYCATQTQDNFKKMSLDSLSSSNSNGKNSGHTDNRSPLTRKTGSVGDHKSTFDLLEEDSDIDHYHFNDDASSPSGRNNTGNGSVNGSPRLTSEWSPVGDADNATTTSDVHVRSKSAWKSAFERVYQERANMRRERRHSYSAPHTEAEMTQTWNVNMRLGNSGGNLTVSVDHEGVCVYTCVCVCVCVPCVM
jgi:hypothetical protein